MKRYGRQNNGLLGEDGPRQRNGRVMAREGQIAGGGGPDPVDPRKSFQDVAGGFNWGIKEPGRFARDFARDTGFQGDIFQQVAGDYEEGANGPIAAPGSWESAGYGNDLSKRFLKNALSPEYQKHLDQYTFSQNTQGRNQHPGLDAYDQAGQMVGGYNVGDAGSKNADLAMQLAVAAIAGGGAAQHFGLLGGAAPAAEGLTGLGADMAAGAGGGFGGAGGVASSIAPLAAPTMPLNAGMIPALEGGIGGAAGLGTTGLNAMRAGELAGYSSAPGAAVTAATPATGGLWNQITAGLGPVGEVLNSAGSTIGDAADWLEKNKTYGRLLMGGAGALMSGMGGGQSGGPAPMPSGPPRQWNSALQQGLMAQAPQASRGLLGPVGPVQGMGAARWLRGGG